MQIYFQNNYKAGLYVAIAYYNNSCDPPWQSEGWWGISPGNSAHVLNTCNPIISRSQKEYLTSVLLPVLVSPALL
jgi:uncharacterized membrane protein